MKKHCNHPKEGRYTKEKIFRDGTKHVELRCGECNQLVQYIQKNKDRYYRFYFGKHNGKDVGQILRCDPGYIAWVLAQADFSPSIKKKIEKSIQIFQERNKNI